jgi:hypothetical protein
MGEVSIICLDLAKSVFQVHGADASGSVLFPRKLRRAQVFLLGFLSNERREITMLMMERHPIHQML